MATKTKKQTNKNPSEHEPTQLLVGQFTGDSTAAALRRALWECRGWALASNRTAARQTARVLAALLHTLDAGRGDLKRAELWAREVLAPVPRTAQWYFQFDARDPFPDRWSAVEQMRAEADHLLGAGMDASTVRDRILERIDEQFPELKVPTEPPKPDRWLKPDAETIVRRALRHAGMPSAAVRGIFNYRDTRTRRRGTSDD